MADRTEPMNFTGVVTDNKEDSNSNAPKEGRNVSTGTMPDFAYSVKELKVGAVSDGFTW